MHNIHSIRAVFGDQLFDARKRHRESGGMPEVLLCCARAVCIGVPKNASDT